jgi:hypothetical protein
LEEVRALCAAEDALTAHAELRSALKIVQRVVESVEAPAWHIVDSEKGD